MNGGPYRPRGRHGSPWKRDRRSRRAILAYILSVFTVTVLLGLMYAIASADYALTQAFAVVFKGGEYRYDEQALRTYAQNHYDTLFAGTCSEDNLLILILPWDDGTYHYDMMAVAGTHTDPALLKSLGELPCVQGDDDVELTEQNPFELRLVKYIRNVAWDLESNFTRPTHWGNPLLCDVCGGTRMAFLYNESKLPLDETLVNPSLRKFTESTKIGLAVVVADRDAVFERYIPAEVIYTFVLTGVAVVVAVAAVFLLIFLRKRFFPPLKETVRTEAASDHDKLDDEYWKDRY